MTEAMPNMRLPFAATNPVPTVMALDRAVFEGGYSDSTSDLADADVSVGRQSSRLASLLPALQHGDVTYALGTYLWKIDLTAAYRQVTIHLPFLWMCHTPWDGQVYLDRRMQFGDKSAVEGFQSITNLLLCAAQAAIDGDVAMRASVPHAAHLWQYIDARPTNEAYRRWELERLNEFGEGPQLRLTLTSRYIDGFVGGLIWTYVVGLC